MTVPLEDALRLAREEGRKAFVPYVTAGLSGVDAAFLRALQDAGADALEVGIPFSDPVMDGPVIQEAARRALESGGSVDVALSLLDAAGLGVPAVLMTYLNPVLAHGQAAFLSGVVSSGAGGVVIPDLPVDEADEWVERCLRAGVASVFLAAPNSSAGRLRRVAEASRGFVYCVSTFGVTGARDALAGSARVVVEALRRVTDRPLLVGVGISTPDQAAEACRFADGVVVGSALVEPMLRGDPDEALRRAQAFREACRSEPAAQVP